MRKSIQLFVILLLAVALPASAQVIVKHTPAPYVDPSDGAKLYQTLCASCHGDNLMGREAVQTTIPHNMNLRFASTHEALQVRTQIAFGSDANHHQIDMPNWTRTLRRMYLGDDARVRLAIHNLTEYVLSK